MKTKSSSDVAGSYTYYYDRQNQLAYKYDELENDTTFYTYDLAGRLVDTYRAAGNLSFTGTMESRIQYQYDEFNRLKGTKYTFADLTPQSIEAVFGNAKTGQDAGRVYGVKWNGSQMLSYTYDALGRMTKRSLIPAFVDTSYTYLAGANGSTTTLVSTIATGGNDFNYRYTYDSLNRITKITDAFWGTQAVTYAYDALGRLTRENDRIANKTYVYTYDKYGNIQARKTYAYTAPTGTLGAVQSTVTYMMTLETFIMGMLEELFLAPIRYSKQAVLFKSMQVQVIGLIGIQILMIRETNGQSN